MKTPSIEDRAVKVAAYLTDAEFGHTHWRAAQFAAPEMDRYGVLILFESEAQRNAWLTNYLAPRKGPFSCD